MTSTEELIERWRTGGAGNGVFPDNDIRNLADALKVAMDGLNALEDTPCNKCVGLATDTLDGIERICEGKGETSV
jgi:hypothetical protein